MNQISISWEIRGRRFIDGGVQEFHIGIGFGPDSASAIAWLKGRSPEAFALFADSDLRAIADPLPVSSYLPTVSSFIAGLVVLACVCVANGGQSASPSPEVFHDEVGLSADLPSKTRGVGNSFAPAVGGNLAGSCAVAAATSYRLREETGLMASVHGRRSSDAFKGVEQSALSDQSGGMPDTGPAAHSSRARNLASVAVAGNGATAVSIERRSEQNRTGVTEGETSLSFDRDLWAGIGLALGAIGILVIAGIHLDRLDSEESARRVRKYWNNLSTPTPGAECASQPTAPIGTGERRGFFYGTSTPAETKATHSKEMSAENT